jgi:hypothetical protein
MVKGRLRVKRTTVMIGSLSVAALALLLSVTTGAWANQATTMSALPKVYQAVLAHPVTVENDTVVLRASLPVGTYLVDADVALTDGNLAGAICRLDTLASTDTIAAEVADVAANSASAMTAPIDGTVTITQPNDRLLVDCAFTGSSYPTAQSASVTAEMVSNIGR